jgi:hypothetical protein
MRSCLPILALLTLIGRSPASAQATNADLFGEMAVECAGPALEGREQIAVSGPSTRPYLGAAVTGWALRSGIRPFPALEPAESEPSGARARPAVLQVSAAATEVIYRRAGRRELDRRLGQTLRIRIVEPDGSFGYDTLCSAERTDRIRRADLKSVEQAAWPETQGAPPPGSWRARFLEPVVITGATAVATYLFFSLRSRRSQDGG